jgi:RNA polymerase sigma factor (sigma-70 family)
VENKYAHSDFDSFYLEYSLKLWRLAYRLTRNRYDSEDLVDEAFLIYLQKSITMVIDNPEAYITRILANLVRNYARLSWHNELPIDVLPEESTLSTDGVGMRLREVLPKGLSPQEQEILLLRFEERLSYSEIADVLKIKEVSCRSRLMRAKAHLLNLYEKEKIL